MTHSKNTTPKIDRKAQAAPIAAIRHAVIGAALARAQTAADAESLLNKELAKMSDNSEKVVAIKRTLADEVRGNVAIATSKATEKDHKAVAELVRRATGASYSVEMVTLTPGMCGLLFLNHNSHNRPWNPGWTLELARRMKGNQWKQNSMAIGFYADGTVEDMQHRCGAASLSDTTWTVPCVFGVDKDAVDTIDGGKRRSGADHAGLDGITDPGRKQAIVKASANYFVKSGDGTAALKSEAEVKAAIEANDQILTQAIEIGEQSRAGIAGGGVLKQGSADAVVYVLLKSGWPVQSIREKLALFQTGVSTIGESEPFFVAANLIEARKKKAVRGEKLTLLKEIGIAIFAMVQTEKGVKSIQAKHVKAAVDGKTAPDPQFPLRIMQAAE